MKCNELEWTDTLEQKFFVITGNAGHDRSRLWFNGPIGQSPMTRLWQDASINNFEDFQVFELVAPGLHVVAIVDAIPSHPITASDLMNNVHLLMHCTGPPSSQLPADNDGTKVAVWGEKPEENSIWLGITHWPLSSTRGSAKRRT
jgi:hypothetical protein